MKSVLSEQNSKVSKKHRHQNQGIKIGKIVTGKKIENGNKTR